MQAFGRPRAAEATPVVAVALAAAFLFLVALSIALQPPATAEMTALARVLAWARALLFSAGAGAFLLGLMAFARVGVSSDDDAAEADVTGLAMTPAPRGAAVLDEEDSMAAAPAVAEEPGVVRFTLVALGDGDDDPRAILDFRSRADLLAAMRDWPRRYPAEVLVAFGPDGAELARLRAEPDRHEARVVGAFARAGAATGGA